MLVFVILGLVYVFLSLPLFPYNVFKKLERSKSSDDNTTHNSLASCVVICIVISLISIIVSCGIYTSYEFRKVWYIYLLPIIIPIAFQTFYAAVGMTKKYIPIAIGILSILLCCSIVCPIRDFCLRYVDVKSDVIVETTKPLLDNDQLSQRFEIITILSSNYDQKSKIYIYFVNTRKGTGLITNGATQAAFYPCNLKAKTISIRNAYPSKDIAYLGMSLVNETNLYANFAILERNHFFERPKIVKEVKLNLISEILSET